MAKLELRNRRPKVTKLPDGRLRATFAYKILEWVGQDKTQIAADVFIAFGTEAANFSGLRLIAQEIDGLEPNKDGSLPLIRVYEEIPETAEVAVGNPTKIRLEDGRDALEVTTIQLTAGTYTPGVPGTATYSGDASAFLQRAEATDDGAVRTIKRTYVYAGTLSQSDETKSNGKLLLRTLVAVKTEPATPSGYTVVSQDKKNVNGLIVYTYSFAKGAGRISSDIAYKQNGKLKITTVRYLDTDDGSAVSGTLINDDSQAQDGYIIYTKGYAEIVGDGIVSSDIETKHNGKLRLYRIVRLGSAPTAPTPSLTPTAGTVVATATDTRQEDGFTLYDYRWSEGYGRISLDTETKEGTALTLATVRYFDTDDGVAPDGPVIRTATTKEDGVDLITKVYASGDGEVSRDAETRHSGQLLRTTIRHLTALAGTQPTTDPHTSGSTITTETKADQDGYRLWTVTWTKVLASAFIVDSSQKRNKGKLVVYRREKFGGAPAAPSATIGGTVVETDSSERLEDGFTVYVKEWAEGVGTIIDDVTTRHNGKLILYRKVALGTAPTAPSATIGGTMVQTQDDEREESGVTLYSRAWAEGVGVITTRQRPIEGFLRPVVADVLAAPADNLAAVLLFSGIPVGTLVDYSTDQMDGVARWALLFMAEADGTAIVDAATQGTFQKYEGFVYPGRAKYYTQTVAMPPASSVTGTIHDVFLSPPEQTKVLATHTISYQTSAAVGALANTLWNPTDSATINAKWTATNFTNYFPRSKVEGLRGYRAVNSGGSGTTAGSDWTSSVFGDTMPAGATWAIDLSGGPADPAGSTWTLHAEVEPAFYDLVNGVQWYRRTVISATPGAQTALPV